MRSGENPSLALRGEGARTAPLSPSPAPHRLRSAHDSATSDKAFALPWKFRVLIFVNSADNPGPGIAPNPVIPVDTLVEPIDRGKSRSRPMLYEHLASYLIDLVISDGHRPTLHAAGYSVSDKAICFGRCITQN